MSFSLETFDIALEGIEEGFVSSMLHNHYEKYIEEVSTLVTKNCASASQYYPEIEGNFFNKVSSNNLTGRIQCEFGNNNILAFIANYGAGSAMEQSTSKNPWLAEYLGDERFNQNRLNYDMSIIARPIGTYSTFDWGTGETEREGSGATEKGSSEPKNWENSNELPISPHVPTYFLEKTLENIETTWSCGTEDFVKLIELSAKR